MLWMWHAKCYKCTSHPSKVCKIFNHGMYTLKKGVKVDPQPTIDKCR